MLAGKARQGFGHLFLLTALYSVLFLCQSAFAAQNEVDLVNRQIWNQGAQWSAAETSISQLPPDQRQRRLGLTKQLSVSAQDSTPLAALPDPLTAPTGSLNWVNYNYVTPVKDQGNCGSCWAFATTAALESQVAIATGSLLDLAEQIIVSCSGAGNCEEGGYLDAASNYILNVGVPLEACFPYTGTTNTCSNATCPLWQSDTYSITGWHPVSNGSPNLTNIKNSLYTYGPLIVSLDIYEDLYHYSTGVYSHVYGTYQGGHAVLLVGYDDSLQCFIAKNSWGTDWGEAGFFKIAYSQISGVVNFAQETIAYEGYQHSQTPCKYSLSAEAGAIGPAGGTLSVDVTANSGCSWTVASNAPWITVTSGASWNGSGLVSLSIPAYKDSTRYGTVTIAGTTYTVTQGTMPFSPSIAALLLLDD